MDLIQIIILFCALGIIFVLPSTAYTFMFFGVFYRKRPLLLEKDNLKDTHYYPYREELKAIITKAKQIAFQTVTVRSDDGLNLTGRFFDEGSDTTVVLVHGFQSTAYNNFSSLLIYFLSLKLNVLMIDQRAHGSSKGRFTTGGAKEQYDVLNWISWLDENTSSEHIFLYGISMGATTLGHVSDKITNRKVKGLIMESGFTSFYNQFSFCANFTFTKQAALNYNVLCAKKLLKADIKKSTTQSLSNTSIPVLFLHGSADCQVPLSNTQENYHACTSEKTMLIVEGAGHTLCHLIGKETVEAELKKFIVKHRL